MWASGFREGFKGHGALDCGRTDSVSWSEGSSNRTLFRALLTTCTADFDVEPLFGGFVSSPAIDGGCGRVEDAAFGVGGAVFVVID